MLGNKLQTNTLGLNDLESVLVCVPDLYQYDLTIAIALDRRHYIFSGCSVKTLVSLRDAGHGERIVEGTLLTSITTLALGLSFFGFSRLRTLECPSFSQEAQSVLQ